MTSRILKGARLVGDAWVVQTPGAPPATGKPAAAPEDLAAPPPDPQQMLAEVQRQIEERHALAEAEIAAMREQARQEAYQEGFAQGQRDGEAAMRAQWQISIEGLVSALERQEAENRRALAESEPDLVRLALLVASKILTVEAVRAEVAVSLVGAAIAQLGDHPPSRLRVSPFDHLRLSSGFSLPGGVEVIADPAIGAGGVIVESPLGRVDARFSAQFRELARALLGCDAAEDPALAPALAELTRLIPPAGAPDPAEL